MTRAARFVRFNIVGAAGIGVQFSLLWFLTAVVRLPVTAATIAAVGAAVVHNFLWHVKWTWNDGARDAGVLGLFARFAAANGAVSLAGNLAVVALAGLHSGVPTLAAGAAGIAVSGVMNFCLADACVFRPGKERPGT